MNAKISGKVRFWYGVALSVMTVILGALFIWQVLDIYITGTAADYTGKFPFSAQRVASHFSTIAPAFWLWIAMVIVGFVLWEVFPVPVKKTAYKDTGYALARLKKRIPSTVGEELVSSLDFIRREEKIIKILWLCCAAVGLAGIVYSIVYLAIPSHFPKTDVTGEMLNMVKNVFPWAAAAFAVACGVTVYEGISAKKQFEHAKKLAAGNPVREVAHGKVYAVLHHKYFLYGLRAAIAVVAVAFVIAGIFNENMARILEKAINICTECIGLG